MTEQPGLSTRVLNALGVAHRGKSNGIHAKHLADKLGLSGEHGLRCLRKAIADLRELGIPIAGMPETGYFIAESATELDDFCIKFLETRAMHSLKLSSRLRKIPLPVLCGQLLLNQA
jgi:predicted DNA-binding transcriptional regulator YafY